MGLANIINKVFVSQRLKKREYDPEIITIDDVNLPFILKEMDKSIVNSYVKSELKSYQSLQYNLKNESLLNENEYHAYQIAILILAIRKKVDLNILSLDEYFHKDITKLDNSTIEGKIHDIYKKFNKKVSRAKSENMLKKEIIFSPLEAGYLLYFISFYRK